MLIDIIYDNSTFREFYIPISFIIVALGFETVLILTFRGIKYHYTAKITSRIFFAFAFLLLGYTLGFISLTVQRFFLGELPNWQEYFYTQTWFFFGCGNLVACALIEYIYRKTMRTYYFFTIFSGLLILINLFAWNNPALNFSGFALFLLVNLFLIIFFIFMFIKSSNQIRKYLIQAAIGFSFYVQNFFFANQNFERLLKSEVYLIIAYIFQILGAIILFIIFFEIPVLNDLDWRETIEELYIISKKYMNTIYYYNFKQPDSQPRELYAGGIIGVQTIINSISQSGMNVEEISQEDSTLVIYQANDLIGVLSVRNSFRIHAKLIQEIIQIFDEHYGFIMNSCEFDCSNPIIFNNFFQYIQRLLYQ